MNLFKKAPAKTQPVVQPVVQTYPVEVRFWDIHRDGLAALIKDAGIDLNELEASQRFNCKLAPSTDYPGAMKVFAAVKGRGKTYHEVGHLRADTVELIRPDIAKVNAKTHYWSLRLTFDIIKGTFLWLSLFESKFKPE